MSDDTVVQPEPDDDAFDEVPGDIEDYPVDDYRLSTRPRAVSGGS